MLNIIVQKFNNFKKQRCDNFKKESFKLFEETMKYQSHTNEVLMKEIKYLITYTFKVLEDDFYLGRKKLNKNFTEIDDYVFSKYRKVKALRDNIDKLLVIAFSNRFNKDPKKNLLAYFVFIEECGFEIISMYKDYYDFIVKNNNLFNFSNIKKYNNETKAKKSNAFDTIDITRELSPYLVERIIVSDVYMKD